MSYWVAERDRSGQWPVPEPGKKAEISEKSAPRALCPIFISTFLLHAISNGVFFDGPITIIITFHNMTKLRKSLKFMQYLD